MSAAVIRLPTAAPRQVQQPRNRHTRAAARALREESPFPERFMFPGQREAMKRAEVLSEIEQTPALLIAEALFALLDRGDQMKVIAHLAAGAAAGRKTSRQAVEVTRAQMLCFGDKMDLLRALEQLRGEQ